MKVLFVASGNSKFGISPLVKRQGESLVKIKIESKFQKKVEVEYFPITGKGILSYYKHISLLKKHLKENKYGLIHAHYGLCGIVAQLARGKEKLVVSFMGDDLIGAVNDKGKYSLFGNVLVSLNKLFLKRFDYIIVKSNELSEQVKQHNKEVIPNGVDLKIFFEVNKKEAKEKLKIEADKRLIIFVSNPEREEKNFKLAKEAVDSIGNDNIQLLSVFNVEQEELKYYYSAADVLLLTSYHEGSPNVIKEAMACNCPIVSTDVGDVRWVIGETKGCYLISKNEKSATADRLKIKNLGPELVKETSVKLSHKSKKIDESKSRSADILAVTSRIQDALRFAATVGRTKGRERIIKLGLDSETIAKKIINIYNKVLSF